ncbi:MAG: hypothetical protein C5B58_13065 [Acidobacteria bacterium]|nr:MAG: hypothetical protein C5B58_13065 [Acidobacteriota bacterium]
MLYTNVRPDVRIARDKIFGPVGVVIRFRDEEEAIRIANALITADRGNLDQRSVGRPSHGCAFGGSQMFVTTISRAGRAGGYKLSEYGFRSRVPNDSSAGATHLHAQRKGAARAMPIPPAAARAELLGGRILGSAFRASHQRLPPRLLTVQWMLDHAPG